MKYLMAGAAKDALGRFVNVFYYTAALWTGIIVVFVLLRSPWQLPSGPQQIRSQLNSFSKIST